MKIITKFRENKTAAQVFPIALLAVLCGVFALCTGGKFLTGGNLSTLLNQCLVLGTIATGAAFIFGTGNVNLAMGGMAAISAVAGGYAYVWTGSMLATFLVCIGAGILASWISVVLSDLTRMSLLTITTVLMMLYPAIQSWVLGANTISVPYLICSELQKKQIPLIIFAVFLVLASFIFYFTPVGRWIRFQGDNNRCAELTGFNQHKILTIAFVIGGIACGLGAFSTIVRTTTVSVTTLSVGNMNVVLSIVIGGMPIMGGYKTQPYSGVLGAAVLTVLDSGLLMIGVDNSVLQAIKGVIFMLFVVLSWKRPDGLAVNN